MGYIKSMENKKTEVRKMKKVKEMSVLEALECNSIKEAVEPLRLVAATRARELGEEVNTDQGFERYVADLEKRIGGEVAAASLKITESIWGHSVLTVCRMDGVRESWETMITLDKNKPGLFKWRTRKL